VLVFKLIDLIADEPGQVEFRRSHGAFIGGALQVCFTEKSVLFAEATQFIGWMEGQAAADHVAFQPGCVAAIKAEVKKEKDCIIYVRALYKAGYSNLARFGAKAFKQRRDRPLDQLKDCASFGEAIEQLRSRVQGKAPGEKSKSRDVLEVLMAQSQIATDAARDAAIGQSKGKLTAELLAALQVRRDIICQQPKVVKAAATSAQPGDGDAASTKRGRPGF
jgi:hypothetical protein